MTDELISPIFYNRQSAEYGAYKVIKFLEQRGKTKVPYYLCKFKDSGNLVEATLKSIMDNTVIDIEAKKAKTAKVNKKKKQEAKQEQYNNKRTLRVDGELRLLALDLSSHCSGWGFYHNDKLISYGYIHQPAKHDVTKRLNGMKHEIVNLIDKFEINAVCVEDIIMKNKIALHVLSKIQGVILDVLYERWIDFCLITPISWKTFLNINRVDNSYGKNSREDSKLKTVECVRRYFGIDLFKEYPEKIADLKEHQVFDVADAICIGKICIKEFVKKDGVL